MQSQGCDNHINLKGCSICHSLLNNSIVVVTLKRQDSIRRCGVKCMALFLPSSECYSKGGNKKDFYRSAVERYHRFPSRRGIDCVAD